MPTTEDHKYTAQKPSRKENIIATLATAFTLVSGSSLAVMLTARGRGAGGFKSAATRIRRFLTLVLALMRSCGHA